MAFWTEGSGLPEPAYAADNPVMASGFTGFLTWIWGQDEAHATFQAQTGARRMPPPRNGLDRMIDDATGAGDAYTKAFITWAVKTQWGEAGDPSLEEPDEFTGFEALPNTGEPT
jgi:hypothetical protein